MLQQTLDKADAEYAVLEQRHPLPNCQIERLQLFPSACREYNTGKNRYSNVLPPEKTRVVLEGQEDYINANLLRYREAKFISCQAPVPSTFNDFWRMVWEKRAPLIVMLTNLIEKGVQKADSYWPVNEDDWFGDIHVKLLDTRDCEGTTIRTIRLSRGPHTRHIFQLHFTVWPDFGVPEMSSFLKLLSLTEDALSSAPKEVDGPPIVHCSAGVGRSGVFISSVIVINELKNHRTPSVFDIVQTLREQRHGMVQTKDQYLFVYLVLNHHHHHHLMINCKNKTADSFNSVNSKTNNNNNSLTTTTPTPTSSSSSPPATTTCRLSPMTVPRTKRKYSCRGEDSSPNKVITLSLSFSFPPENFGFASMKSPLTHSDGGVY
jgi:protein tyrosine phosphatase